MSDINSVNTSAIQVRVPRRLVELFLKKMTPLAKEVVELFSANADQDGLTPRLRRWITMYEIRDWALAYKDPALMLNAYTNLLSIIDVKPAVLDACPQITTVEELHEYFDGVWVEVEKILLDDVDIEDFDDDDDNAEERKIQAMPDPQKAVYIGRKGHLVSGAMIVVFNYFAVMTHRKSMFRLVNEACQGGIDSLLAAIQIDKSCLATIPFFREIAIDAMTTGNRRLVDRIMDHRLKRAFQGNVKLSPLYLVLSLIDSMTLLEQFEADYERFACLCQSLGIYGPADDAVDVDSFARAIRRFKSEYLDPSSVRPRYLVLSDTVSS